MAKYHTNKDTDKQDDSAWFAETVKTKKQLHFWKRDYGREVLQIARIILNTILFYYV